MLFIITIILSVLLSFYIGYRYRGAGDRARADSLLKQTTGLEGEVITLRQEFLEVKAALTSKEEAIKKLTNQKKSSEVRTGLIAEQMAPFLQGFPYNPKDALFLGRPVDFVVFDTSGVHFVEVKSGKAQLTQAQRLVRDQIANGKVTFETYRVEGG